MHSDVSQTLNVRGGGRKSSVMNVDAGMSSAKARPRPTPCGAQAAGADRRLRQAMGYLYVRGPRLLPVPQPTDRALL